MRIPSRRMAPATSTPITWRGVIVLSCLGVAFVAIAWRFPAIWVALGVAVAWAATSNLRQSRRLSILAAERPGESICTFARAFDCRAVDTWVIRAVYEELQPCCKFGRGTLPLRATDDLKETLGVDHEELDEIADAIAARTGRSLDGGDRNPHYGKVKVVADVVLFFAALPMRQTA